MNIGREEFSSHLRWMMRKEWERRDVAAGKPPISPELKAILDEFWSISEISKDTMQ